MVSRNYDLSQTPSDSILIFPDVPASPPSAGSFLGAVTSSTKLAQLGFFAPSAVYIPIAGGTMTGPLILSRDPQSAMEAATKRYTDTMLPLAGGQMSGPLSLFGDGTQPLHAVTKQQLDAKLNIAGGTMTGLLILSGDPSNPFGSATKRYVDNTLANGYLPLVGGTLTGPLTLMSGDTYALTDPRLAAMAYAWQDTQGAIAGAIHLDGTLEWGATLFDFATIGSATIQSGTAALSNLTAASGTITTLTTTNFTASGTVSFGVGSSLNLSNLTVSLDTWGPIDPRISGQSYSYGWFDSLGAMAGGVTYDGTLRWGATNFATATIGTLTATTATLSNLNFSGALAVPQLTVGDTVWGPADPRLSGLVYTWQDSTGAVGGAIATDGTFNLGLANVTASLTLQFDATQPNHALRKAYADVAYINASGGTMTGVLHLPVVPSSAPGDQAVNKAYVDSAAASGGAGGLAGLTVQRDFPYPPLRDPKRDYGAIGDGVTDDSSAINQCVAAALAAGERAIAINDPMACPNLNVLISQVLLIGTGRLVNANVQMFVIPPWAPAAPTHFRNRTMTLRNHCAKFATKLRNQQPADAPAVVVVTGESTYAPSTSSTVLPIMWARAQFAIKEANPGKHITFYNRAIGGQRWSNLDGLPTIGGPDAGALMSWYTDGNRAWIEYIRDLAPDVVLIGFSGNDGIAYELKYMTSVLTKLAGFANPPDVILCTSNPYAQQYITGQSNTVTGWEGQQAAASMERTWAIAKGIGLVDTSRAVTIHAKGFDPDDIPLKRDLVTTANMNARKLISLPFTWLTRCWGFAAFFYVPANGWALLGNELQFELGITWGGGTSPVITPRAGNAGCILRIGRDTTAGQIYYQVDTCLTALGGAQNLTHIPKTLVPGWVKPATDSTSFSVSVVGSRLVIQTITGSSPTDDQWTAFVMEDVPRYSQPWFPKITCTAGTVGNALYFEKAADGYAYAAVANPDQRAFYMPTMTEHEAYGSQDVPETDWSGGGVGHDSALKGIWAIQCALNSCDWGA